ncbi:YceK/YidQ family lipoprotein [Schlesneria paludicola]|uniref:YceK/YidQ family lipoprotein n=1 Tax=Schlesneria paludicola TaxID=360056 RepID=UPI00029AFF30|nr:YceK/YidQ family lipoprotein [Schlesneria paludicola]
MRFSTRLITIPLATSLLFWNVSCASIGVRTGAYDNRCAIYPATTNDVGTVCYAAAMPFRSSLDPTFSPDAQDGLVYLFAPVAIIDFPLAVAVDTLLLPYDIHKLWKKQHNSDDESTNELVPSIHRDDLGLVPLEPQRRPKVAPDSKQNDSDQPEP